MIIAAYIIFIFDNILREALRHERRGIRKATKDDNNSSLFVALFPVAVVLSPLLLATNEARLPIGIAFLGLLVMLVGLFAHISAQLTLGKFYTGTLYTTTDQRLIRSGLFSKVRHPGYFGVLLLSLGFGLATQSIIITGLLCAAYYFVYTHRMRSEEAMLKRVFGKKYKAYCKHTKRLIPYIY